MPMPLLTETPPESRDAAAADGQDPVDRRFELDLPATFGGRPDLPLQFAGQIAVKERSAVHVGERM